MILRNKIFLFLSGVVIGFLMFNTYLIIKNKQLNEENKELTEQIIDYKWQIEQVPYVIESWCNGE